MQYDRLSQQQLGFSSVYYSKRQHKKIEVTKIHNNTCCVALGSKTRIYEFRSKKCRSVEVGNAFPRGKLGIQQAPRLPTRKYELRLGNTSFRAQWNAAIETM